jgi:Flp pilus assembly pilin Flp
MRIRNKLKRFGMSGRGPTAIEQGHTAAVTSVAIIAAIRMTGGALNNVPTNVSDAPTIMTN